MHRVVITGGPGAGKTTLLVELAAMGHGIVEESARAIISERLAAGLSPRPEPLAFAREIMRRDIEKYLSQPHTSDWVFFDRGLVEAIGGVHELSPFPADELNRLLASYPFHASVFILPPWQAIYANDAERDQSFAEAVHVHAKLVQWYRACGYVLHEVPRLPVSERAAHVLRVLAESSAILPTLPSVQSLLEKLSAMGITLPPGPVQIDGYGDSPRLSEELLALIRSGRKRAGTSLLWAHELDGQPIPLRGSIDIVVDHLQQPVFVVRNTSVDVVPFNQVTAEYAAIEGEGDGSLAFWRSAHQAFFGRECQRIGREPRDDMPVVCCVFEVLDVVPGSSSA